MMPSRRMALALLAATLAACGEGTGSLGVGGSLNTASVRLINATAGPLDLTRGGQSLTGATGVASGAVSACVTLDLDVTTTIGVRRSGTTSDVPFAPGLSQGGSYAVVAYPASGGTIQVATLPSSFTATSSGLRVFNGAPMSTTSVDVYVTAPNAPLVTPNYSNIVFGSVTPFFNVTAGTNQLRFTDVATQVVLFDAGNLEFPAGKSQVFVLAAPNGTFTSILAPAC